MTYETFKKQLFDSLLELKATDQAKLGLLKKGESYEDETVRRVIRAVNLAEHGREEERLDCDLLYAVWDEKAGKDYDCMLYWPVRMFYDRYRVEGWQGVLPELAAAIRRDGSCGGALPALNDTYLKHRQNLILRPVSYEERKEELENCVYWLMGDIALALYLLVYDDPSNFLSMKLERTITEQWHKKDAVLLTGALLNCMSKMPPRLYFAQTSMEYYDEKGGVFLTGEKGVPIKIDPKDQTQGNVGYYLTTTRRINGAIAIFYPGVRERLAELLNGDYYVVFVNVNGVNIYPLRHKLLSDLKEETLRENALLEKRQFLSGHIYRYVELRRELVAVT